MVFPLAALGAGFGQFAQDYRQQQAQQERTLMLQMQLANWQREMDKDRREASAADIFARFDPSAALTGPGGAGGFGALKPQTGPQGGLSALTGPIPGMGGAPGGQAGTAAYLPSVRMQPPSGQASQGGSLDVLSQLAQQVSGSALPEGYRVVQTSGSRPGATVAGTGGVSQHALNNAVDLQIIGPDGPIPNTGEDTTGLYGKLALAMRAAAPPELAAKLGWGGNFTTGPANGPKDLMHFDLAGDRGRYGTLAQMAQLGGGQTTPQQAAGIASGLASSIDTQGPPQPPTPPLSRAVIAQMIRADEQFKNADYRAVGVAVANIEKSLQETYRNKQTEYQDQLKLYHDYGPGRQQRRQEELQDAPAKAKATAEATAGIPTRAPQTHKEVTLEGGATVTGIPGRPETWTTMTGKPLTPDQLKMLDEGRIQKFGSASSQVDPVTVKATAKGIAEYKLAPVTSWAQRTPFGQAVMKELTTSYPDYDQAKYKQREQGLIAFTKGRQGDSVRSISVAIDHLGAMEEAAQALETGDVQLLNRVEQWAKQQFGYEAPVDFDFVKNVVGGEVSKAVIGGIGGVTDREEMRAGFQRANSPEQLAGVIKQAKKMMAAQLDGYRRQSESTGFPTKDFDAALSPRARQELEGLARPGATPAGSPAAPAQQQNATPPQGARLPLPPEFASKPDGTGWRNKQTGKIWVKQGNEMIETPGVETPQ